MSLFEEGEYVDIKSLMEIKKQIEENVALPALNNITEKHIEDDLEKVTPAKQNVQTPQSYMHLLKPDDGCEMNLTSWTIVSLYAGWYLIILYVSLQQFVMCAIPPTLTILPFMIWWYSNRDKCPLYEVICCYADGMNAFTIFVVILYTWNKIYYYCNFIRNPNHPLAILMSAISMATIGEVLKASMYHLNSTHEDLYKPKRAIIVSLIISMGFAFGESLYIISNILYIAPNLDFVSEVWIFIGTACVLGTPLHILCGCFSGVLNTLDDNNHFKSCVYTIPARALYMFGEVNLLLNPSPYSAIITTIVSGGAIAFLMYFIHFFSKSIPEIADKSYMSLLAYAELSSDTEEEGEREIQERMI